MSILMQKKIVMPSAEEALPGSNNAMPVPDSHFVNGHTLQPPFPDNTSSIIFGMGCFWGAEKSSGNWMAYIPLLWVMRPALRLTLPISRFVQA